MDLSALVEFCITKRFPLSEAQVAQFAAYAETLYDLNQSVNLTRVPKDECVTRHFIDSLLLSEFIPPNNKVLDIGTGAGFPSWPLACARPDIQVTALDSAGKAQLVIEAHPLPNMEFTLQRAEEDVKRATYDIVTGRAVAQLAAQLELSAPWAKQGGLVIPFRTPNDSEIAIKADAGSLGLTLEEVATRPLPRTDVIRLFPIYKKIAPTRNLYPRPWSQIKKRPLTG